ncbi:hypothetical protein LIA77_00279 [Sarocladium implicatum]|nr:hypothetical protein LIA77_00279 [Sarocladium implicatum]
MAHSPSTRRRRRSRSTHEKGSRHRSHTQQHQAHHSQEHTQNHVQNLTIQQPQPSYQHWKQSGRPAAGHEGWARSPTSWTWHGPNVNFNLPDTPNDHRRLVPDYDHERGRRGHGPVRSNEARPESRRERSSRRSFDGHGHWDKSEDLDPRHWRTHDYRYSHPGSQWPARPEDPCQYRPHPHEPPWVLPDPPLYYVPYGSHEDPRHWGSSDNGLS